MPESPTTQVLVADEFKRQIRDLAKRYRQIRKDIQPLITQLKQGEIPGDQISGVGYTVLKVRTKNSDIRKGKSGGYRIIYQILDPEIIILLYIYAKSDQVNIAAEDIRHIIENFQPNPNETEPPDTLLQTDKP
jgi:mRNA-degrading endonuclease RelE of RelBE toxin-antitoxin system